MSDKPGERDEPADVPRDDADGPRDRPIEPEPRQVEPEGPPEIVEAALQELEYPADETDEG